MTVSMETAFRSRLKKDVKKDRLEQLIVYYKELPEGEAVVRTGAQLEDNKLFFCFASEVPSFKQVYGELGDKDLDDIVGVTQKLAKANTKIAFGFLKFGKEILVNIPEYCRKIVLGMTRVITDPLALWTFIENSAKIAKDAEQEPVFKKWFDDGASLTSSDQVAHFSYDATSQAVLNYFKIGGMIFPVSSIIRPYADYAIEVLDAIHDHEYGNGVLKEFVDYLRSPAGKVLLLNFYDGELGTALKDFFPIKDVLKAGFVHQKTKDLLERIGINEERLKEMRDNSNVMYIRENTLDEEYALLTGYLTKVKSKERDINEAEKERTKIIKGYELLIDDINGKRYRLAQIKKELKQTKEQKEFSKILNKVYDNVGSLVSEDLKKEIESFKDDTKDKDYTDDAIHRIDSNLEEKATKLKEKHKEQNKESAEKLDLLRGEKEFYKYLMDKQLKIWPITKCPRIREKDAQEIQNISWHHYKPSASHDKQTWLWLPEGITITGDEYRTERIGEHTYITRKEWRN